MTNDWSECSYLVLKRNSTVPGDSLIIIISYKYNARKALSLIATEDTWRKSMLFPIYISNLTCLIVIPFDLFIVPFPCLSYLYMLIRLTPKQSDILIYHWKIIGFLSVVGCGYVQQFIW